MTNYADEIKSRLTAREVFEHYGFPVNHAGFVCCPLHGEKTPSLKVYNGSRGWYCYGCHKGGDVLDFIKTYFGIPFQAALEKANQDFNLGLPIGQRLSRQEQIEAQRKAEEQRRRSEERRKRAESLQKAYDDAFTEWKRLDNVKRNGAPKSPEEWFSSAFAYALRNIDGAAYQLEEAQAELFRFQKEKS